MTYRRPRRMKYVITGCFGFVGAYLVREIALGDPDAEIVAVDRQPAPAQFPPVKASYCLDLLDLEAFAAVLARETPDYLVHLASFSSVGFSWKNPVVSFSNNTNIFLNVLECVRRGSPRTRILSVGSSEEYGIVEAQDLPLRETSPLRPVSPYAVARVAQEHLGDVYVRGFGLDIVATRSFNHVGAGQSDQFVISAIGKQFAELAKAKRTHLVVGTTTVVRDFLDVRDVVKAYRALLPLGRKGDVYNVCSGRGVSIADAIQIFETITKLNAPVQTDPALVRPVENAIVVGSHDKLTAAVDWRPSYSLEASLRGVYDYWCERV
jgi:GDP-4-dehydro-6-deoxy-D-mannose reductase